MAQANIMMWLASTGNALTAIDLILLCAGANVADRRDGRLPRQPAAMSGIGHSRDASGSLRVVDPAQVGHSMFGDHNVHVGPSSGHRFDVGNNGGRPSSGG